MISITKINPLQLTEHPHGELRLGGRHPVPALPDHALGHDPDIVMTGQLPLPRPLQQPRRLLPRGVQQNYPWRENLIINQILEY